MPDKIIKYTRRYAGRESTVGAVLFVAYLAVQLLISAFLPLWSSTQPSHAIAIAGVYFGAYRLAFVAGLAGATGAIITGWSPGAAVLFFISATAQSALGAYLLRTWNIDPLFRRRRDVFYTIAVGAITALIPGAAIAVGFAIGNIPDGISMAGYRYIGELATQLIVLPFLLRWLAKPMFSRTALETLETIAAFLILLFIAFLLFVDGVSTLIGIPLEYYICVPLFWIALRMRPRFITLALISISTIAIVGVVFQAPENMLALFETQLLIIGVASGFLIISAQEEERRTHMNRTKSELQTLENAVTRVNIESKAKNEFIAVLSHELRNPLAPVVSSIEFLRLGGPRSPDEEEALAVMSDRLDTVRHLLDDLLDVSRITEGKILIKEECVELSAALQRSITTTAHHRDEFHQTLEYVLPESDIHVRGDRVRIEQIFSNLLTNASKYSNPGDAITMSVTASDQTIEVRISDEGVGIPAHMLEKIFLPFQQIEQGERTAKGLGIGLALVRKLVELHGGTVYAQSEGAGTGSTLIVRLPRANDCAECTVADR